MPPRVIRQQLSLTPRQVTALERLAQRLHRSKADLVRDAVERYLENPPRMVPMPAATRAAREDAV